MTTSELKDKIASASNADVLNNIKATFNFPYISFKQTYTGLSAIYEFVNQQTEGWEKFGNDLPQEFKNAKGYFVALKNSIIQFIPVALQNPTYINDQWTQVQRNINATQNKPFLYNIPETEFILKVYNDFPTALQGAYAFITGTINQNLWYDKNYFSGTMLAYEFTLKDHSQITERRNAEISSITKIRNDFQGYLSESEKQLAEHIKNANTNFQQLTAEIKSVKEAKEALFNEWFEKSKDALTVFNEGSGKKIKDLENTYEELLRLKKPAEYWKLRADKLKKEGWKSLYLIIGMVLLACSCLYFLLWKTPEGMLKTFFSDDKSEAVRWSIVFITFISFLAFGIRALIKVTFSSFHLSRDAEEREQLTYVYLAMVKDTTIDKEDKHLIMQALFSRADTGLLKDDSAPTMPGTENLINKIRG